MTWRPHRRQTRAMLSQFTITQHSDEHTALHHKTHIHTHAIRHHTNHHTLHYTINICREKESTCGFSVVFTAPMLSCVTCGVSAVACFELKECKGNGLCVQELLPNREFNERCECFDGFDGPTCTRTLSEGSCAEVLCGVVVCVVSYGVCMYVCFMV